jgi:hypothetical protein
MHRARDLLGDAGFEARFDAGRALDMDEAAALVVDG